jgi:hypothetical protein
MGGLGNQMFQYALGRCLADINNCALKLDVSFFETNELRKYELRSFNIVESIASKREIEKLSKSRNPFKALLKKKPAAYITEKHYHFDSEILNLPDNVYLEGYWQSEKYFDRIKPKIMREFAIKLPPRGLNERLHEQISGANSVGVHVRRRDYVSDPAASSAHGICSPDYYRAAVSYIRDAVKDPVFFVFSDDMELVKPELSSTGKFLFVDHNSVENGFEDLRLMSHCRHQIIANSSFSWWGAWLNPNPEKIVIAPHKWFNEYAGDTKDLYPPGWIKI